MNVSKKYINAVIRKHAWDIFHQSLRKTHTPDEYIKRLQTFLTKDELITLEKRLAIPVLLRQGMSYRAIGKELDVSFHMISFVKKGLKRKPVIHKKYSDSLTQKRKRIPKLHFLPHIKGLVSFHDRVRALLSIAALLVH